MSPDVTCSAYESLLARSHHADAKVRAAAIRSLCPCHVRRNIPAIWNRVIALAEDSDVVVRKTVLHILADGSPRERADEVAWIIGRMANDADDTIRRRARRVLAAYRRHGHINVL